MKFSLSLALLATASSQDIMFDKLDQLDRELDLMELQLIVPEKMFNPTRMGEDIGQTVSQKIDI